MPETGLIQLETIKQRSVFVRMNASAKRFVVSNFILQMLPDPKLAGDHATIGYTVTKKLGNAVVRNRIKRRLRVAVRQAALPRMKPQHHYVVIARHKAREVSFAELLREMEFAFSRIGGK